MSFYLYFSAGLIAGFFGGMGLGGGTLLIPILTLLYSVPQFSAQGINLLSFLPMALFSLPVHFQSGYIRRDGLWLLLLPALLFSFLFSLLAKSLNGELLSKCFGVFLCLLALYQLISALLQLKKTIYKGKKT